MKTMNDESDASFSEESDSIEHNWKLLPEASKQKYLKEFDAFLTWRDALDNKVPPTEDELIDYFNEQSDKYSPSTLWTKYSMIKLCCYDKYDLNLKKFKRLILLLKKKEKGAQPKKKAKVFEKEQLQKFWDEAPNTPDYLIDKLISQIGYFGLMRSGEILQVTFEMLILKQDSVWLSYNLQQKTTKDDHVFVIPRTTEYLMYLKVCDESKIEKTGRFFKTYRKLINKIISTPMGIHSITASGSRVANFLQLSPKGFTGHCWRRTGATALANEGSSSIELKTAGRWLSEKVAQGYVDNSGATKMKIATSLNPDKEENLVPIKKRKFDSSPIQPNTNSVALPNGSVINITFNFSNQ